MRWHRTGRRSRWSRGRAAGCSKRARRPQGQPADPRRRQPRRLRLPSLPATLLGGLPCSPAFSPFHARVAGAASAGMRLPRRTSGLHPIDRLLDHQPPKSSRPKLHRMRIFLLGVPESEESAGRWRFFSPGPRLVQARRPDVQPVRVRLAASPRGCRLILSPAFRSGGRNPQHQPAGLSLLEIMTSRPQPCRSSLRCLSSDICYSEPGGSETIGAGSASRGVGFSDSPSASGFDRVGHPRAGRCAAIG